MNKVITEIRQIAEFYGVRLIVLKHKNCALYQKNGVMEIGISGKSNNQIIQDFCNLMGLFISHAEGKYEYYNEQSYFKQMLKYFTTREKTAEYCVRAELYAKDISDQFIKQWFPKVKKYKILKNKEFYMGYFESMWDC